jgi:hypothetical protein
VDGGGRALASAFSTDRRRLAYAWLAAWDEAEAGHRAEIVKLAARREEEARQLRERSNAERMSNLQQDIASRHSGGSQAPPVEPKPRPAAPVTPVTAPAPPPPPTRQLINVDSYVLANPEGEVTEKEETSHTNGGGTPNPKPPTEPDPSRRRQSGKGRAPAGYTPTDKETVGLELVRRVLAGDDDQVVDIRHQHGVGADAIDGLRRFYELKVHAEAEPDVIRLTNAEVERALSTPDFFLVVVSNVESGAGGPQVRIITDPLNQLDVAPSGSIELHGVRKSNGIRYHFETAASADATPALADSSDVEGPDH